jgi:hypothetical protein
MDFSAPRKNLVLDNTTTRFLRQSELSRPKKLIKTGEVDKLKLLTPKKPLEQTLKPSDRRKLKLNGRNGAARATEHPSNQTDHTIDPSPTILVNDPSSHHIILFNHLP